MLVSAKLVVDTFEAVMRKVQLALELAAETGTVSVAVADVSLVIVPHDPVVSPLA